MAHNCHIKFKSLTSNSNRWHQIQCSHQIQIPHIKFNAHIKFKLLTSNSNLPHQIQIAHITYKSLTGQRLSQWTLSSVFTPSFTLPPFCAIVLVSVCVLSSSPIRNILRAKCTAVIVGATLKTAKNGLTAEYPSTPKEILKSVATRLRRNAECRLSYRGHVEFKDGYAATRLRRKPRVQALSDRERQRERERERERERASYLQNFVFHSLFISAKKHISRLFILSTNRNTTTTT